MDERIVKLTRLAEREPSNGIDEKDLRSILNRHNSPWQPQNRTFWGFRIAIGTLGFGIALLLLALPVLVPYESEPFGLKEQNTPQVMQNKESPNLDQAKQDPDKQYAGNAPTQANLVQIQETLRLIETTLAQADENFDLEELD